MNSVIKLIPALFLVTACGDLATDDPAREDLVEVEGSLTNPDGIRVVGELRVALVWETDDGQKNSAVAQDVAVSPEFPAGFTLTLNGAPPETSIVDRERALATVYSRFCSGSLEVFDAAGNVEEPTPMKLAACIEAVKQWIGRDCAGDPLPSQATRADCTELRDSLEMRRADFPADFESAGAGLIAYDDVNGNGELDLLDVGAQAPIDRILGRGDAAIVWTRGTPPANAPDIPPGYLVLRHNEFTPTPLSSGPPLRVVLADDEALQTSACRVYPETISQNGYLAAGELPEQIPAGTCEGRGQSYAVPRSCAIEDRAHPVCGTRICHTDIYAIMEESPAPAHWPCALTP